MNLLAGRDVAAKDEGTNGQRWPAGAVLVLIVAGLGLATGLWFSDPLLQRYRQFTYDRRLGVTAVIAAADNLPYREIAPRLTAGFAHRPLRERTQAGRPAGDDKAARKRLHSAFRGLLRERDEVSPLSLHSTGIAQIILDRTEEACASLEAAARAETGELSAETAIPKLRNTPLLSDLSAAYYLRGVAEDRTELLLRSIEAASRARELEPGLASPAFNRALAIEAVHVPAQAVAAWHDYLRIDAASGWADEARQRIRALSNRERTRKVRAGGDEGSAERLATRIEAELLPAWADAFRNGDAGGADRLWREIDTAAASLQNCCGGTFHRRALAAVRTASRTDRRAALRLAIAHQQYRDARNLYAQNDTTAALPLFEASRDAFRSAGDVFAAKPWKYVAACALYLGDSGRALWEMHDARAFCEAQGCPPPAVAHLQWVQGMASGRAGDPQAALAYYNDALRGFEQGREHENAASIRALIAENLEFLGAGEKAWPYRRAALERAWENGTLNRIYLAFNGAADAALHHGYLTSARLFQDVIVDAARREGNTVLLADALLWRARIFQGSASANTLRDLEEADLLAAQVTDEGRRSRLLANISTARARIESPAEAVESLTTALRFFEESDDHYRLAELYAARAEAREKASQPGLAEADYQSSIRVLESLRSGISEAALRERFFSGGSTVFDRVIRHLWVTGRRDEAFALAEQSRGRELNGGAALPRVTVRELSSMLRGDEALVEYVLLEDRLAVWVVRSKGAATFETPVSAESLERAVASLQSSLGSRQAFEAGLARLAAQIYAPIAPRIGDAKRLIVVPNKALRAVPFSALRNAATGRYLVEERELLVAPSASAWADAVHRGRALRRAGPQSVLVASFLDGDPARNLPPLQHGGPEVQGLRTLYGRVDRLEGLHATPERVLESARSASVVHIAAHAVQNPEHPEYSSIALAPGPEGRDLYAHAVAAADLRSTRFVFLSSCGTPGRTSHNDAPLTLPESFLSAGVPLVVGSLRPVDDQATAGFALALHRAFAASGDAVAALREAQLQCIASPGCNDPRFWSAWIVLGGAA